MMNTIKKILTTINWHIVEVLAIGVLSISSIFLTRTTKRHDEKINTIIDGNYVDMKLFEMEVDFTTICRRNFEQNSNETKYVLEQFNLFKDKLEKNLIGCECFRQPLAHNKEQNPWQLKKRP